MNQEEIMEKVYKAFENADIYIYREMDDLMEARDYITDSFRFIQLIVQLEKEFSIEIPDDLLMFDNFDSFDKIYNIISGLIIAAD